MAQITLFAEQAQQGWARDVWQGVALPASRGLLAHARRDWSLAVASLGQALPRLMVIGGSHAQRDLFEQIYQDAQARVRAH